MITQRGTELEQTIAAVSEDGFAGTVGDYRYTSTLTSMNPWTDTITTTITNTWKETGRDVYAKKIWDDDGNRDGKRPGTITLELWADENDTLNYIVLDGIVDEEGEAAPWVAKWKGLQKFHADETPIIYTIKEQTIDLNAKYDEPVIVSGNPDNGGSLADPYTVTNHHELETTSFTVKKMWVGDESWLEDRPESVKVQLYKTVGNGKAEAIEGTVQELNAANSWQCIWNDLPKYENPTGSEMEAGASYTILYTVKEIGVDGYTSIATDSNAGLQNTLNTTQLTVRKAWEDQDDHYKRRPSKIAVRLERHAGTDVNWLAVAEAKGTISLKGSENWSEMTFIGLPTHNKNNVPYQYRAVEESMDDERLKNNQALGYKAEHVHTPSWGVIPGVSVITNTLLTKEISGTKIWEDQSDVYNTRLEKIQLSLASNPETGINGNQPEVQPEWKKEGDTWTFIWKNLPKLARDGTEIVYSVTEEVPTGYTATYGADGLTITNTLETIDLDGSKIWEDQSNRYGLRPAELEVTVYADGVEMSEQPDIQWIRPEGKDVWSWQVKELPKVTPTGEEIIYTVEETNVPLYAGSKVEHDLTNRMEEGALIVKKTLEGGTVTAFEFLVELIWNDKKFPYTGEYHVTTIDVAPEEVGEVKTTGEGGVITIESGQKFRIDRLPAGVTYQVTEKDKSGYQLKEKTGDQGTISKDIVAEVAFVNKRKSGGGGSGNGDPTKPGPGVPTEPTLPTEPILPTEPTAPTNPSIPPSIPFDPDDPVIDIPGNPPRVEITDPEEDLIYNGPGTNIDIGGWGPGEYKVYTFDEVDVPLGMLTLTIDDEGIPLAFGLPKTGDQGLPYALLATIMLGALGGMVALIYNRKKEQE